MNKFTHLTSTQRESKKKGDNLYLLRDNPYLLRNNPYPLRDNLYLLRDNLYPLGDKGGQTDPMITA